MTKKRFNQLAPAVQKRVRMEMQIAQRVVKDAIKAGWRLTVDYGEGDCPVKDSTSVKDVVAALMECDEEYLILRRRGKREDYRLCNYHYDSLGWDACSEGFDDCEVEKARKEEKGWVRFVYGNDGWDVINDHSTSVDDVMEGASRLAERLEERAR